MKMYFQRLFFVCALMMVACTEPNNPVLAGSTEIPNMSGGSVLCRRIESGAPIDYSSADKCFWTAEMWNRESGYRVHTGFDNGTNTSGIWYWTVKADEGRNVYADWTEEVSADYDSMALSKVIDKCNGSLCGYAVFERDTMFRLGTPHYVVSNSVSLKFSLAGKDSSGKFKSVDARSMQGICVEYYGDKIVMGLDFDDSLTAELDEDRFVVELPKHEFVENQKRNEVCYPWSSFTPVKYYTKNLKKVEDFVAHLIGFNFTMEASGKEYQKSYFNIVSLGRYSGEKPQTLRPAKKECNAVYVKDYFCECSYPDERLELEGQVKAAYDSYEMAMKIYNDTSYFMNNAAKKCIESLHGRAKSILLERSKNWEIPCDNPLPKTLVCDDGSFSESQEYADADVEFERKRNSAFEMELAAANAGYTQCKMLRDTLSDGRAIPDTCKSDKTVLYRNLISLVEPNGADTAAINEFGLRMDSLYKIDSISEAVRYCALHHRSNSLPYNNDGSHPIVKTMQCKSGNKYYTDEYKELLQVHGIDDVNDSLQIFEAFKKEYLSEKENYFNSCVESYGKNGCMFETGGGMCYLWDGTFTRVHTGYDNGSGTSGKWFYQTDSADGGKSHIVWDDGYVVKNWNDPKAFDSLLLDGRRLKGSIEYVRNEMTQNPYVNLGFWLAGENSKGGHDAVDISDKKGIGFVMDSDNENLYVQLDMGDSLNALVDGDLFTATYTRFHVVVDDSGKVESLWEGGLRDGSERLDWDDFKQAGFGRKMNLEDALKHVVGIRFHFENPYKDDVHVGTFDLSTIWFIEKN